MNKQKTEKVDFFSRILGKEMPMQVFWPGHGNSQPLPVLYFLHGRSGNENIMFEAGINTVAGRMAKDGAIKPLAIVCPRIGNSRGLNSSLTCKEVPGAAGTVINLGMYEDYLTKELIPFIDKTFATLNGRQGRYIGGASAGGYAALHIALRHQDMFSKAGGHMPALEPELEEEDKPWYDGLADWESYDPLFLAENDPVSPDIEFYLDAGDNDEGRFYEGCAALHEILERKGVKSQNHIFPGRHNVEYIGTNIGKYLQFYGA